MSRGGRWWVGSGLVVAALVCFPAPAGADPPGPTDYRTEIVSIEPPTGSVAFGVVGGDSLLEIAVTPPAEVVVLGYEGEPYLRIDADGGVFENQRSPSAYLNDDRYGIREIPPDASADADPMWGQVGEDGRHVWHDHRAHWMSPSRPIGLGPGDQILEGVVPLEVDGRAVSVKVESTWLPSPPLWPALLGGLVAAGMLVAGVALGRGRFATIPVALIAGAALAMGCWAFLSVPSDAGPSILLWLLPAMALLAAVVAAIASWRSDGALGPSLTALAGLELLLWGWQRWESVTRAIIPSDAPADLDRAVIVAALVGGLGAMGLGLRGLQRSWTPMPPPTGPDPAEARA